MKSEREARILGLVLLILGYLMFWAGIIAACLRHWYYLPMFWALAYFPFHCFMTIAEWLEENYGND